MKSLHQNSEFYPTISVKIIRSAYYKTNKSAHQNSVKVLSDKISEKDQSKYLTLCNFC